MENDKLPSETVVAVAYGRWSFTVRGSYDRPLTSKRLVVWIYSWSLTKGGRSWRFDFSIDISCT